jgi:hypothetical protein
MFCNKSSRTRQLELASLLYLGGRTRFYVVTVASVRVTVVLVATSCSVLEEAAGTVLCPECGRRWFFQTRWYTCVLLNSDIFQNNVPCFGHICSHHQDSMR